MSLNDEPTSFDSVPIIDYSLLVSGTADERSKVVQDLGNACKDWGCYMLVNHGISETLIQKMMDASNDFFNMTKQEKLQFEAHGVFDPIRYGGGFNSVEQYKDSLWREYIRLIVHPDFHGPHKPLGYSEVVSDYVQRTYEIAMELLKAVSESLGFEALYMHEQLNLDAGLQLFATNHYPCLSEIDTGRGLMSHTDHGLMTLLYENGVPGLEVLHNGKWISMGGIPNAFLVLTADHLEIFTNGIYKSKFHRSVVKDKRTRITFVNTHGPSLDTVVSPSPRLIDDHKNSHPGYISMKYNEYMELQVKLTGVGKHAFDKSSGSIFGLIDRTSWLTALIGNIFDMFCLS